MKSKSTFQIIILFVFGVFLVIGVLAFSGVIGGGSGPGPTTTGNGTGQVVMWGTLARADFDPFVNFFNSAELGVTLAYVEKDPTTVNQELVEALAAGTGPDVFMLAHDDLLRHADKVLYIPYDTYPEKEFDRTFIGQATLYKTQVGLVGLPFTIDPMVMYYNRDLLSTEFIIDPPQYWDEFLTLATTFTEKTANNTILKSTLALGTFDNVRHAKDILSTLMLQAGTPIVRLTDDSAESALRALIRVGNQQVSATDTALEFYTEFSNPASTRYSWNPALPESRSMFLSGDLVFYFGPASEALQLRALNPNLNFGIALMPQQRLAERSLTYGTMQGLAISKQSDNVAGAYTAVTAMTGTRLIQQLSEALYMPPVRLDVLRNVPDDLQLETLYNAAFVSRGWLDPSDPDTDRIFEDLVENITSGRMRNNEAISDADGKLNRLSTDKAKFPSLGE